ncbi:MBL fold metallo-hydrolase [Caldisericum sp.]|jgi:7,8-dihydropterin-6-yl-methyl-4-(beta-D-ribofuranosyl)aminobenzene 5'-phosphate synthase|uniref:MBL fold metallo-hydrolase n=1 Tax=Caldisericum sp. TaxID=2499687 RepID=UPI003D0CE07D
MKQDFEILDKLKVIVLAEDSVMYESPYLGQHGISLLIEAQAGRDKKNIIIDVGQNIEALSYNMKLLNIDPSSIDAIILTHCHYDHTHGVAELLKKINKKEVPIIAHPELFKLNFVESPFLRHVGVMREDSREHIEENGGRLYLTRDPLKVFPGILTTGEVKRQTDFEEVGIPLKTLTEDGKIVEDRMMDDTSVIGVLKDGLVILSGCSHAGIINIVKHSVELTGINDVLSVIGGFHLIEASYERIKKTVEALVQMNVKLIYAGHCTGFKAQLELYKVFGNRFTPLHTGMILDF